MKPYLRKNLPLARSPTLSRVTIKRKSVYRKYSNQKIKILELKNQFNLPTKRLSKIGNRK